MKLSLAVSCIAAMIALSGCRSARGYVERGNKLFEQSKYGEAQLQYKRAIQKDDRFAEAYYRLGLADLKLAKGDDAYEALSHAVAYDPKNLAAKAELAGVCLSAYTAIQPHPAALYHQAQSLANDVLAANPESVPGLLLRARMDSIDRKSAAAVEELRHALRNASGDPQVESALAEELMAGKEKNEAEKLARDAISHHADYVPAYNLLFKLYSDENRSNDIEALLKSWAASNPTNSVPVLRLAWSYWRQQRRDEAEKTLSTLTQRRNVFPNADLQVGDFHALMGDGTKAIADYQNGLSNDPKNATTYLERLAGARAMQGRYSEGIQNADKIIAKDPKNSFALAIKINSLLAMGGADNIAAAAKLGQESSQKNPNDPRIQLAAGEALLQHGELDQAETRLQQAAMLDRHSALAHLALARLNLTRTKYSAVVAEANAAAALQPDSQTAKILRIIGLTGGGAYAEAKAEALRLPAEGENAQREMQLGNIALAERKFGEAEEHFQKLYHRGGTASSSALEALVSTYIAENRTDRALQVAQEGQQAPGAPQNPNFVADAAISAKQYAVALAELRKAAATNPKSAEIQVKIGEMEVSLGDLPAAIDAFQRGQQLTPDRLDLDSAIGVLQDRLGRTQDAIASYRKALKKNPNDPTVANNLAFLLAETGGDLNEALQLATQVNRSTAASPSARDTLAWVEFKQGHSEAAVAILSSLTRSNPGNPSFHYHYGAALMAGGKRDDARQELQQALGAQSPPAVQQAARTLLAKLQ